STSIAADQYLAHPVPDVIAERRVIQIAPGFAGQRLALPEGIMPTAICWLRDKSLAFSTLKGQVYLVDDDDSEDPADPHYLFVDGLATPYGIGTNKSGRIEVLTKTALLRFSNGDYPRAEEVEYQASGWGVTNDYHDWAIGLTPGKDGERYLGLPCQQDGRKEAAAKYRGQVLKLVPNFDKEGNQLHYTIETVSTGHRFPLGLALNRAGDLFVTDNQGNYNPFNELNHVRPGAFFGFVNAIEKKQGTKPPPLVPPAIDIPHPWTRSVNGICFLDTPKELLEKIPLAERADYKVFGPLEGHLVGCEYDSRQLIRMTLQRVGDTYQGAAYPLSIPPRNIEDGLLGPLVCAVSPRGELYVGNIRDSGWGAGNNVGDIVKIKIEPEKLPGGIQEVRATSEGFVIDFFRPVDRAKATNPANYALASYRRESTSAYGGPNLDRRIEKLAAVTLSDDARQVSLRLKELRPGFVYEFQLQPLTRGKELFHPAEAHYTLRQIPAE
ncbi:MAG: hypothetical protein SFU86_11785, partial [Pirellulaceae bacterium]|nr:hypothetical protein [Pirellulaceae bacterium]